MTTPFTSSEGMRERSRYAWSQSWLDMPTAQLERYEQHYMSERGLGLYCIPDGLTRELNKRRTEDRLKRNWDQLQREGFGL